LIFRRPAALTEAVNSNPYHGGLPRGFDIAVRWNPFFSADWRRKMCVGDILQKHIYPHVQAMLTCGLAQVK
jgi:hypothetical protein